MSKPSTILSVLGTRPEIIKLSPLLPRLSQLCERSLIVHSGQHYSYEMDALFFEELQLPRPDYTLQIGRADLGANEQLARMLYGLEPILAKEQPNLVIVQGDTNTTLAGALAAVKCGIPVVHLEAGCRSFNRAMPEEINRVMIDHIAQLLLAPDKIALQNLRAEGCHNHAELYLAGSTGLEACRRAASLGWKRPLLSELGVAPGHYLTMTLHRAENTTTQVLPGLVKVINALAEDWPIVFPVHPRTEAALDRQNLAFSKRVIQLKPLGYLDMLQLISQARVALTDSGGLQEEAAALGTPVLVLRNETEWVYLVEAGKAALVGNAYPQSLNRIKDALQPECLKTMQQAQIPLPSNMIENIVQIIADFTGRAVPSAPAQDITQDIIGKNYVQV